MKIKITTLLFLCFAQLNAQDTIPQPKDNDIRLAALPYYNYGKGLGITSPDSIFQFNIRFRMQNRLTVIENQKDELAYEGQIRRLRLRFDGYVGDPRFLYVIQLSFAPGDVGAIREGDNINIIRDAVFSYKPNRHWSILFGQTKLPGNRQRVNSSGALQLTDRTINNARFNIDRDFGLQVYYSDEKLNRFSYSIKTAISTGEGRNWTKTANTELAYTAKLELLPLGAFTKNGVYFEGDLMREKTPKVMVSAAYSQNNNAKRAFGQLGDELFEDRTIKTLFIDGMLKYRGLAFMTAYMERTSFNLLTVNPDNQDIKHVFAGHGWDFQLSYIFTNNFEIIGRFSDQKVNPAIRVYEPDAKQYSIGLTKYFWEHSFKIQTEYSYNQLNFDGTPGRSWYLRFQIEMGI